MSALDAVYRAAIFYFLFASFLGALNAVDAASTTGPLFLSTGSPANITSVVNNTMNFNATQMTQAVQPSYGNGTIIDIISYYGGMIYAFIGYVYQMATALFSFFKIVLGLGSYLQSLIPFMPIPLVDVINGLFAILYTVGLIEFIRGIRVNLGI
jgi:hypothetical protein